MKIKTLEDWSKELIYYQKSVAWIAPDGTKYSLWSKIPHVNKDGEFIQVDNVKMSIEYYDWIRKNKQELLKI